MIFHEEQLCTCSLDFSFPCQQVFQSVKTFGKFCCSIWINVSMAERRQMVAVVTSAAPLPIFLAGHFASDQINVHLLFRCLPLILGVLSPNSSAQQQINSMATAPPFCTISLSSSSLMLLLSLFSAFPQTVSRRSLTLTCT